MKVKDQWRARDHSITYQIQFYQNHQKHILVSAIFKYSILPKALKAAFGDWHIQYLFQFELEFGKLFQIFLTKRIQKAPKAKRRPVVRSSNSVFLFVCFYNLILFTFL